jgi:outer membrane protein assembly factor BamB
MPPDRARRRRRRRAALGGALIAVLLAAGGGYLYVSNRTADISHPGVSFTAPRQQRPPRTAPADNFVWPIYGYTKERTRYLAAPANLRPPFKRVWTRGGRSTLLEFPPVIAGRSLYLLKNNGALYAISKATGRVRWKRKLGSLSAASPAYGHGVVYVVLLQRFPRSPGGRVAALATRTGRTLWSRKLPSRSESSPLLDHGRLYFGTQDGTVFALRASDGQVRWTFRASGSVKGGLALSNGRLYFGDYGGRVHCVRARDGRQVWSSGTSGAKFGLAAGQFYSTPAVAFGRVYIGNTDGRVYSFAADSGKLAWRKGTGSYVYASAAAAAVPGTAPTVYVGSYDGHFYALDARSGSERWSYAAGGKISGSATVVGDIVYFSNLAARTTIGLGVRTGKLVFHFGRGAFNPVVSDGKRIYLTGYSTLYALEPKR